MPRAGLTRQRVVSRARQLAEEIGIDQLTMSGLAGHLGVKQPSLYKHISSIADLRRTMSTIAARELGNEIAAASQGKSGSSAIYAVSHAYRNWATDHPDRYLASQMHPAPGDGQHQAILGAVSRTFAAAIATAGDCDPSDQLDRTRAARAALHGFISLESAHSFGVETDLDRSFEHTIHGLIVAFEQGGCAVDSFPAPHERPVTGLGFEPTDEPVTTDKER